jgi:hypothetical protein
MGMSNWIFDNVEDFYKIANEKIGECETLAEFASVMKPFENLLAGSAEEQYIQEGGYHDLWGEFWSKYV